MKRIVLAFLILATCSSAFGAQRLFYEGFESGSLANVQKTSGVTISKNMAYSGTSSARVQYGPDEGNQSIIKRITSGISNEFYIKYYIKKDVSWQANQHFKPFRANNNYSDGPLLTVWGAHACDGYLSGRLVTFDGMYDEKIEIGKKQIELEPYSASTKGWTKIEIYVKKNSATGVYDGIYKLWWNGVLIYSDSKVHPATATGKFFDCFYFPSNMSCDKYNLKECCSAWDQTTPFYLYVDDIEIWNGMPTASIGITTGELQPPSRLIIK